MTTSYINIGGQTVDASTVTLPADREFRDAWVLNNNVVEIDTVRALEIKRSKMVCSAFQARAALAAAGLLDQIDAVIVDAEPAVKIAWEYAVEFRRMSPTILGLASTVGLTDNQLDDLFLAAMQIEA